VADSLAVADVRHKPQPGTATAVRTGGVLTASATRWPQVADPHAPGCTSTRSSWCTPQRPDRRTDHGVPDRGRDQRGPSATPEQSRVADNSTWTVIGPSTFATADRVDVGVSDAALDATARGGG